METSIVRSAAPGTSPRPSSRLLTLPDLAEHFAAVEDRQLADAAVPLAALRMTPMGTFAVPGRGEFAFTDWSRHQLSLMLGLRWDRWFAHASAVQRADEINRRLARALLHVRLRLARGAEDARAHGVLRAFVSPTYTVVPDSLVTASLVRALAAIDTDLKIIRSAITDRTTSFVVAVGKPQDVGGQVGAIWGGLLVRNSDVGFASLVVVVQLTRLICSNGMRAPLPDAELVRRRHVAIEPVTLEKILADGMGSLPERLLASGEVLRRSTDLGIEDVEAEIRGLLRDARLPIRNVPTIVAAYAREPMPTAFGISQAITLAAQDATSEERIELEDAAGRYLARVGETGRS